MYTPNRNIDPSRGSYPARLAVTATTGHVTCGKAEKFIGTVAQCKLEPFFFVERLDNKCNHQLRLSCFTCKMLKS